MTPAEADTPASHTASAPDAKAPAVLQVLPRLEVGGVERGTADITAALAAEGWRAIVVSAGGPMVREIERAGGTHITLPADSKNPLVMRRNAKLLTDLVRDLDVDIVHARSRAPAWSARAAARQNGVAFVTTFHGAYGARSPFKKFYNAIMTKSDLVIAISDFIHAHVIDTYGVEPERLRTIYRGVDIDIFDPDAVSPERMIQLAQQWRLPDDAPVIMLPGRLTRWKGHDVLVEAARRLDRRDVRVLLVGADHGRSGFRDELDAQIHRLGVEGIIHLTEPCRDMAAAYMLADVVVSASTEPEAFGRVPAEAQAMGRPVIATDLGGARETVISGETGWLVPAGDADSLARALRAALAMKSEERDAVAQRARQHVVARFTKQQMCNQTLAAYRELLEKTAAT